MPKGPVEPPAEGDMPKCSSASAPAQPLLRFGMRSLRVAIAALTLTLLGMVAQAQLLVEVALAPAIASQLFPPVSWPSGSLRAAGTGADALIARVPDHGEWQGWEVYTATGLAASLQPALVYGVERDLMMQGLFRAATNETGVGAEHHTRVVFSDGGTQRALLYVIRSGQELVWLVARGR